MVFAPLSSACVTQRPKLSSGNSGATRDREVLHASGYPEDGEDSGPLVSGLL